MMVPYRSESDGVKANMEKAPADMMEALIKMMTQPVQIMRKKDHWTFLKPPTQPTPMTAPQIDCVDETGIDMNDAVTTKSEAASSALAPRDGDSMVILYPSDFMTR